MPREDKAGRQNVTITTAQQRVLGLIAHGATYDQIAARLFISTTTVRSHVVELQRRFSATNNVTLVLAAVAVDVLSVDGWPPHLTGILEFDRARLEP